MSSRHDIGIREYAPDDAGATIDIFLRAIREIASKDYGPAQIDAWAKVDDPEAGRSGAPAGRPGWRFTRRSPLVFPI